MAWEVAVIVNPEYSRDATDCLARYMPLWIVDTPANQICITTARQAASGMWLPEAVCTSFKVADWNACEHNCLNILHAVDLHHPGMAKLNLIGVEHSELLHSRMKEFAFIPSKSTWDNAIAFRRPVSTLNNVAHLQLDASQWKTTDDVYESLFYVLGSPAWHGKNFHALHDSIVTGQINTLEVPYTLTINGISSAKSEARFFVEELVGLISRFEAEGCPISIHIEK